MAHFLGERSRCRDVGGRLIWFLMPALSKLGELLRGLKIHSLAVNAGEKMI